MREIEFRGRDFGGFWHHGFLSAVHEDCAEILEEISGHIMCPLVSKETVGQYTGLTDKNGVKIFEGDIFCFNKLNYSVFWDEDGGFTIFTSDSGFDPHKVEVVGNIHDNPELLEGVVQ